MAVGINLDRMFDRESDMAQTKIVMGPIVKQETAKKRAQMIQELLGGSYADLMERGSVKSMQEYLDLYEQIAQMV